MECDACDIKPYDWAIPMKCNACEITRYVCKVCLQSPNTIIIRNKFLLVRSKMRRHNCRHLKLGDLDTKSDNVTLTQATCDEISEIDSTAVEGKLDDISSAKIIDSDVKTTQEIHNIYNNEHSYDYYTHNVSMNVEDSGPAFMVGKTILVTLRHIDICTKMIYYFISYLQNLHLL